MGDGGSFSHYTCTYVPEHVTLRNVDRNVAGFLATYSQRRRHLFILQLHDSLDCIAS